MKAFTAIGLGCLTLVFGSLSADGAVKTRAPSVGQDSSDIYGELIIPKEAAFLGELIPIELHFYFSREIWYQPYVQGQNPMIEGNGFVTKKYPEPTEKEEEINGRVYRVLIYKTAISGIKTGVVNLVNATQEFLIRTPKIISEPDDLFGRRPFNNPLAGSELKKEVIATNGASLQIRPLPENGRPADFAEAVGQFTLKTSINPRHVNVGEVVTLQAQITGFGNFDRVREPRLENDPTWHVHRSSADTENLDEVGMNAIKIFQFPLIAERPAKHAPALSFSFFDPVAEKYVQLRALSETVEVTGKPISSTVPAPATSAETDPRSQSIGGIVTVASASSRFVALSENPSFWWWQISAAIPLIIYLLGTLIREAAAQRQPCYWWKREKKKLHRRIEHGDRREVLNAAARLLELDLLIRSRGAIRHANPAEAIRQKEVPEELAADLDQMVEARNQVVYGHQSGAMEDSERSLIKSRLKAFEALT